MTLLLNNLLSGFTSFISFQRNGSLPSKMIGVRACRNVTESQSFNQIKNRWSEKQDTAGAAVYSPSKGVNRW